MLQEQNLINKKPPNLTKVKVIPFGHNLDPLLEFLCLKKHHCVKEKPFLACIPPTSKHQPVNRLFSHQKVPSKINLRQITTVKLYMLIM